MVTVTVLPSPHTAGAAADNQVLIMFDGVDDVVARHGVDADTRQAGVNRKTHDSAVPLLPWPLVTEAVTVNLPLPRAVSTSAGRSRLQLKSLCTVAVYVFPPNLIVTVSPTAALLTFPLRVWPAAISAALKDVVCGNRVDHDARCGGVHQQVSVSAGAVADGALSRWRSAYSLLHPVRPGRPA
ncbi:Uncharacterised protein [Cedecea neteri]|uniref:Uncharacterized protein n=1 Tax=Cedecea neteri TaxID=158822 RepID=A0A2X3IMH4_9ENTR|nr:Uncharacterised protein [Cedecea neteri]